jgi:hypothetical protein
VVYSLGASSSSAASIAASGVVMVSATDVPHFTTCIEMCIGMTGGPGAHRLGVHWAI